MADDTTTNTTTDPTVSTPPAQPAPDPTLSNPGTPASATSEASTGAESTYVHGDQRIAENPAPSGAPDVSASTDEALREMHVDSKLSASEVAPVADTPAVPTTATASLPVAGSLPASPNAPITTNPTISPVAPSGMVAKNANGEPVDQYGRTQADLDALAKKRDEANKAMDEQVQARQDHAAAVTNVANVARDRSMAVQEEVGTRERDGVTIGTPAFERRKATVNEILNNTVSATDPAANNASHADRLQEIASTMHTASPSGIETIQHQLMALATEMRGNSKPAPAPTPPPSTTGTTAPKTAAAA